MRTRLIVGVGGGVLLQACANTTRTQLAPRATRRAVPRTLRENLTNVFNTAFSGGTPSRVWRSPDYVSTCSRDVFPKKVVILGKRMTPRCPLLSWSSWRSRGVPPSLLFGASYTPIWRLRGDFSSNLFPSRPLFDCLNVILAELASTLVP